MFNVSFEAYKSAIVFKAVNDVRFYLNAVFLDAEGFIVTTDGHRLFAARAHTESKESILVDIQGKEPTKFNNVVIDKESARFFDKDERLLAMLPVVLVDGCFPEWRRVTSFSEGKVPLVGFNAKYLADINKAAKLYNKKNVTIEFQDGTRASRIYLSHTDYLMLMPARV